MQREALRIAQGSVFWVFVFCMPVTQAFAS
jgi:hypothetical protein